MEQRFFSLQTNLGSRIIEISRSPEPDVPTLIIFSANQSSRLLSSAQPFAVASYQTLSAHFPVQSHPSTNARCCKGHLKSVQGPLVPFVVHCNTGSAVFKFTIDSHAKSGLQIMQQPQGAETSIVGHYATFQAPLAVNCFVVRLQNYSRLGQGGIANQLILPFEKVHGRFHKPYNRSYQVLICRQKAICALSPTVRSKPAANHQRPCIPDR